MRRQVAVAFVHDGRHERGRIEDGEAANLRCAIGHGGV
jgi:hypothetical protein